jgi:hypothetical protein
MKIQVVLLFRVRYNCPAITTQAQRGGGAIAPTHFLPRHYMDVSRQRHASAAL